MFRLLPLLMLGLPMEAVAAPFCGLSIGGAANVSPAGRDWDLSTPGPLATSASPVTSAQCYGAGTSLWMGVDAVPVLRHSYRDLHGRGPLLFTSNLGFTAPTGHKGQWGLHLTSNRAMRGWGARYLTELSLPLGLSPTVELRLNWLGGTEPDFQAWMLVRVATWDLEAEDGQGWRIHRPGRDVRVSRGFEVGRVTGFRLEVAPWTDDNVADWETGLRVGMLHAPRSGAVVQPLALAFVDAPLAEGGRLQVEVAAGATLHQGEPGPLFGTHMRFQGEDSHIAGFTGLLVGVDEGPYAMLDSGFSWVW